MSCPAPFCKAGPANPADGELDTQCTRKPDTKKSKKGLWEARQSLRNASRCSRSEESQIFGHRALDLGAEESGFPRGGRVERLKTHLRRVFKRRQTPQLVKPAPSGSRGLSPSRPRLPPLRFGLRYSRCSTQPKVPLRAVPCFAGDARCGATLRRPGTRGAAWHASLTRG